MPNAATDLKDKVVFITGSTRGIGREIALRCAKDGAKVVITGKTDKPHETLPNTIYSVSAEINAAGGVALPVQLDVRDENSVNEAVKKTVAEFGGIDILINNAGAIVLAPVIDTPIKRFDLMCAVNVRGTFLCSQACFPYLKKSANPHILNISPPINMDKKWFKNHLAYTISKYGTSMCTLGMSEEFKPFGIAVNSLWPHSVVVTTAVEVHFKKALPASRDPKIMADAAYEMITSDSKTFTGNFFTDEGILIQRGIKNIEQYAMNPDVPLFKDIFIE